MNKIKTFEELHDEVEKLYPKKRIINYTKKVNFTVEDRQKYDLEISTDSIKIYFDDDNLQEIYKIIKAIKEAEEEKGTHKASTLGGNLKIAIIGSRTFSDYYLLEKEIDKLGNITEIVSGGARGADILGVRYAKEHNIKYTEHLPNWDLHGKSAGFKRNHLIIQDVDMVVAFWDGKSKGTKHSIDLAKKLNKKVIINRIPLVK